MTTTTATVEQQEPVIAPDGERVVTFYAARGSRNLTLIRKPEITRPMPTGGMYVEQAAQRIHFAPDGIVNVQAGTDIEVDSKGWLADDQELERRGLPKGQVPRDLLTALRSHRGFNQDFFEQGAEPDRPQPTEDRFLEAVTNATADLNAAALRELEQKEKDTHARPVLLKAVSTAISKVDATRQQLEEAEKQAQEQGGGKA